MIKSPVYLQKYGIVVYSGNAEFFVSAVELSSQLQSYSFSSKALGLKTPEPDRWNLNLNLFAARCPFDFCLSFACTHIP